MIRVLYDNLVAVAESIAATNVSTDSDVDNVFHQFLELALYCSEASTVISGSWPTNQVVNCLGIGFHNCDTATLKGFDDAAAELFSETINLEAGEALYYFTGSNEVRSFTLELSGSVDIYVGAVSLGVYVELPDFARGGSFPVSLRSSGGISLGGQAGGIQAQPLRGFEVEFPRLTNAERATVSEYVEMVQTTEGHFVDIFPDDHDVEAPFYGVLTADAAAFGKRGESGFFYETKLSWSEAR
jgi:hypothetical protein